MKRERSDVKHWLELLRRQENEWRATVRETLTMATMELSPLFELLETDMSKLRFVRGQSSEERFRDLVQFLRTAIVGLKHELNIKEMDMEELMREHPFLFQPMDQANAVEC